MFLKSPKRDYIDTALEFVCIQMKDNLSKNEILDLVKDIQNTINRACREKWIKIDMANQVSNNTQMYQGPGPQGPLAFPVTYNDQQHKK